MRRVYAILSALASIILFAVEALVYKRTGCVVINGPEVCEGIVIGLVLSTTLLLASLGLWTIIFLIRNSFSKCTD